MELNRIANIVMPTSEYVDYSNLFLNKEEGECYFNGYLQKVNIYKFNTWMNLFAAKKYYYYCDLGNIYLKLNIEGKYKVTVTGVNRNVAFGNISDVLVDEEFDNSATIEIPNADKYEGLYFTIIEAINSPIKFIDGAWCTDKEPQRENKLAIVTCTFKREDFVTKNIKKFEKFKQENPDLQDKIYMFISDNGKTLPKTLNSENVTIYPNMNAGGAGGFTRGLMEVIKLNQGFTRVLFMDDDVEICPESFYRTLTISNYLKYEYKQSFIHGAMLNIYRKNHWMGSCSINRGFWAGSYMFNLDIAMQDDVLKSNDIPVEIFEDKSIRNDSAWWYCCYDIALAYQKGLPVPVFFRGDDTEWGWRNKGLHHITMNGIGIWHFPFDYRESKSTRFYYTYRNVFMLNSLYTPNFKKTYKKHLKSCFRHLCKTYDYASLELYFKALEDILRGSDVYRENPQQQLLNIINLGKKAVYYDCYNEEELNHAKFHRVHAKKWRKFVWNITQKGLFCPKFLFKRRGVSLDFCTPAEDFILVKEVKVYNLLTKKYEIRKFDRKKIINYKKEFNKLLKEVDKNYDKLHSDFVEAHKEFTTFEFWEKYLELDKVKNKELQEVYQCQKA